MSENKKKYAYWMKPSLVEEMSEMLDEANATSKSDFVLSGESSGSKYQKALSLGVKIIDEIEYERLKNES